MNFAESLGFIVSCFIVVFGMGSLFAIPWIQEWDTSINVKQVNEVILKCDTNDGLALLTQDSGSYSVYCNNGAEFFQIKREMDDANTN